MPEEDTLEKRLVVLIMNDNAYTFDVKPLKEVQDVKVDIKGGTWRYIGSSVTRDERAYKIGDARMNYSRGTFSQPIGVYDPLDTNHLTAMVTVAAQAQEKESDDKD